MSRTTQYFGKVLNMKSLMANKNHVFLTWHELSFHVPRGPAPDAPKPVKKVEVNVSDVDEHQNNMQTFFDKNIKTMRPETARRYTTKNENKGMKTILHNLSGYAKPGETMAIMGGSGCGKTSFLNILGQRLAVSKGCKMTGETRANNRVLNPTDFSKFGAFVLQDDLMLADFTPDETLRFAAKLKTSLTDAGISAKVDEIVDRLGLTECRHTKIGDALVKGLSGGQKRRCSIGVELITDPTLLLLDEPTSGLDSSTSLKIMRMLRDEAKENDLTIMFTIHMPSAELFNTFDRLLLLNEGYQIF